MHPRSWSFDRRFRRLAGPGARRQGRRWGTGTAQRGAGRGLLEGEAAGNCEIIGIARGQGGWHSKRLGRARSCTPPGANGRRTGEYSVIQCTAFAPHLPFPSPSSPALLNPYALSPPSPPHLHERLLRPEPEVFPLASLLEGAQVVDRNIPAAAKQQCLMHAPTCTAGPTRNR